MIKIIVIFLFLAFLSFFCVQWLHNWLKRSQIFDIPNDRSAHSIPTPRGGGIIIVVTTIIIVLIYTLLNRTWLQGFVFIVAGGVIAWLGWQDDVISLSPKVRFMVQTIVAIFTILFTGYFKYLMIPLIGEVHIGVIGIPLTILWIVGMTNAYNFIDGLDGFAGGIAVIIAAGWIWISSSQGILPNGLAFWIAIAIAASGMGFLPHNWSPATIFMGDVGSTFLGYSFAVLPLLSLPAGGEPSLLGVVMLWAIILDTGLTFIRRAVKHENVFAAHRSHLYQRWVINGVKPIWVNLIFYGFSGIGIFLLWGWNMHLPYFSTLILIGLPLLWIIVTSLTRKWEHDHEH